MSGSRSRAGVGPPQDTGPQDPGHQDPQGHRMADLSFVHRYEPGTPGAPTLLLLHGTGGDENDLVPLANELMPGAAVLSPRGRVLEHGMPRFFRRLAEGVFDLDDLRARTTELAEFVDEARATYDLGPV